MSGVGGSTTRRRARAVATACPRSSPPTCRARVLLADLCELRPAPAEFASSPLGWRDGLVGWRVTRLPDGTQVGEG
ncbi:hypothetical protein V2I01_29710 [Micromonospora sp. BRA006-A]|nr:hypothetical protein [Micromonospora sp. BRA006-A]